MWLDRSNDDNDSHIYDVFDRNTKRILLATTLSLLPGLGQAYAGNFLRGVFGLIGLIIISWICAILILWVESRPLNFFILCIPFIYALALAADAAFCIVRCPEKSVRRPSKTRLHVIFFIFLFILVTLSMDYFIGTNVVRAFLVTSQSMHPTILNLDIILVDKITSPKINDIVLIDFNKNRNQESISNIIRDKTLRRIVAGKGDTVEIRGRQLIINNTLVSEDYAQYGESDSLNIYAQHNYRWGPDVVPDDSFFVLADSRLFGFDSRALGFIDNSYIRGIASKVLWSWNLDEGSFKWERTALNIK
ncbi:MAG: signal peptidase I [Candidatus Thiodiazotropha sp.]